LDCAKPIGDRVGRGDRDHVDSIAIQNILNAHDIFSFSLGGAAPLHPAEVLMQDGKENPISIAFGAA
jgi:hypothetical protein